ncbi:hypothetical protein SAMN00120144_3136 [Hymenobacter roseosalivarius DSM 11622]|uniref:Uncharacterized protein n=1 Tax=Hymenobacter roseosalivarius DSM 11622 TaxID=645990 RepID=A0A1W1UE97_9BACT|nr:hypothetical protein [Hymenobacter roseosalivarius]SMB79428.1 hypothetical protein SAMN00120144_3136 [Hymenobacter roseosalivarius DSM 11622]
MSTSHQISQNNAGFAPQRAYLAVEHQPADEAEAQRLEQLRQLIKAAPDVADLRDFAEQARQVMGGGYTMHCGSSHVWLKRDAHPERLAVIADRNTTAYQEWNTPA